MPAIPKPELHRLVLAALEDASPAHGALEDVPFLLQAKGLIPVAIYAFTVTDPPGGRDADELKIQMIAPGQGKGERGSLPAPDEDTCPILLGYSRHYDVFVLWDAYKHVDFSFSKNCQVRLQPLVDASLTGIGKQARQLRSTGLETILAARPDHLHAALAERIRTV